MKPKPPYEMTEAEWTQAREACKDASKSNGASQAGHIARVEMLAHLGYDVQAKREAAVRAGKAHWNVLYTPITYQEVIASAIENGALPPREKTG